MFKNYKKMKNGYDVKDASLTFILAIIAPYIGVLFMLFYLGLFDSILQRFNTAFGTNLDGAFMETIFSLIVVQAAFLVLFFVYNRIKKIDWVSAVKLNKVSWKTVLVSAIIGVTSLLFFYPIVGMIEYIFDVIGFSLDNLDTQLGIDISTLTGYLIGIVAIAVLPSIAEELLFRGVIYNGLKKGLNNGWAIVISSIMFSLIHMNVFQTVYPLILGVVLALSLYYTKSLIAPIVIHFVNNFTVLTLNFVSVNFFAVEDVEQAQSSFSYTQLFFAIFMLCLGIIIIRNLLLLLKKESQKNITNKSKIENSNGSIRNIQIGENIVSIASPKSRSTLYKLGFRPDHKNAKRTYSWLITGLVLGGLVWVLSAYLLLIM